MLSTLLAAVAGAAVAYFLDPDNGRRRRNMSRDRAGAAFRGGFRGLARATRATTAEAYGLVRRVTHLAPDEPIPENDATLARRVESQVFRDPDIPKGQINVNAEGGVIVLRGELDRPEQIKTLEAAVRRVPGVRDVKNLLHLPNASALKS